MKERGLLWLLFALLLILPPFLDEYLRHLLVSSLTLALLALGWNILTQVATYPLDLKK